jgi:hypothetical protein
MARSASPRVVAGIVRHSTGGKQGRDEKGERRSDPPGIETEVQALEHDNIEFLKDGEVILIQKERTRGERPDAALPHFRYVSCPKESLLIFSLIELIRIRIRLVLARPFPMNILCATISCVIECTETLYMHHFFFGTNKSRSPIRIVCHETGVIVGNNVCISSICIRTN